MSFILDALKKAEHARPPASMPQMPAVSVAATGLQKRRQLPGWLIAGGGALAMLVVVAVGWQFMRAPDVPAAAAPASTAKAVVRPADSTAIGNADAVEKAVAAEEPAQQRRADVRSLDREARAGQRAAAPTAGSRNPSTSQTNAVGGVSPHTGNVTPGTVVYEAQPSAPAGKGGSVRYQRNFANDTPEPAPPQEAQPVPKPAAFDSGLPSYSNTKLRGNGLPELHMDIHVFSQVAENRFIFINSRKYRQGQTTREGVLIEEISPTGAVMIFRGQRFDMARN